MRIDLRVFIRSEVHGGYSDENSENQATHFGCNNICSGLDHRSEHVRHSGPWERRRPASRFAEEVECSGERPKRFPRGGRNDDQARQRKNTQVFPMTKKTHIGTLRPNSYLETPEGVFLLTRIPPQAAQSPESAALEIELERVGRPAVVRGAEVVLYGAEIAEVVPPLLGWLVELLLRKDLITEDAWREVLEPEAPRKYCALVVGHERASSSAIKQRFGLKTSSPFTRRSQCEIKNGEWPIKKFTRWLTRAARRGEEGLPRCPALQAFARAPASWQA